MAPTRARCHRALLLLPLLLALALLVRPGVASGPGAEHISKSSSNSNRDSAAVEAHGEGRVLRMSRPLTPAQQVARLATFLNRRGYSTLLTLLADKGLDAALLSIVKGGTSVTIFAPDNTAFGLVPAACVAKANVTTVLLNHVVPVRLPAAQALAAPIGTMLDTLGPRKIIKTTTAPLGVTARSGVRQIIARVFAPNALVLRSIIVHGIDRVLILC